VRTVDFVAPISMFETKRSPESYVYQKSYLILWSGKSKKIPDSPDPTIEYSELSEEYWFDMEFGYLNTEKLPQIPSPRNGPKGKKIICIKAESDAYQKECEKSMIRMAAALGMELSIVVTGWDHEAQKTGMDQAIAAGPDMLVNIPGIISQSSTWYEKAYKSGIPIISATLTPANEAFKYLVAWCGHDAWSESRMLAHTFAEYMNFTGEYCVIQHMPDTSAYYSRSYGLITELTRIAPKMKLVAIESSYLSEEITEQITAKWIDTYGSKLRGIISPNDIAVLKGINKVLHVKNRDDIIRVSNGTTREGLQCMKSGGVHALTFKSPELDGALPIQIAADWFNGLLVDPIRFLPTHIITHNDVDDFLKRRDNIQEVDLTPLEEAVNNQNFADVDRFFDSIYLTFLYTKVISLELFRGFTIELFSKLINLITRNNLELERIVGTYEYIFRNLFNQPSIEATLEWLRNTARIIIEEIRLNCHLSLIQQVLISVNKNLMHPISLKEISYEFNISSRYLGKLFREETGKTFNDYINDTRIEQAKNYLNNSSMSAAEIARTVGFSDPNYFYKQFSNRVGMSPTDFRSLKN